MKRETIRKTLETKTPQQNNAVMNNSTDIEYYNLSFLPFQLAEFTSES